jgi:hypothetical protein
VSGSFRDHEVVVGVRLPVALVMQEHRKDRHVDVVAGEDDLLARRRADDDGRDPSLRCLDHLHASLGLLAAHRPGVLVLVRIRIGKEGELATGDLLDEYRGRRMILHYPGKLVDPFVLGDADEQAGGLHRGDEVGQRLLRHDGSSTAGATVHRPRQGKTVKDE